MTTPMLFACALLAISPCPAQPVIGYSDFAVTHMGGQRAMGYYDKGTRALFLREFMRGSNRCGTLQYIAHEDTHALGYGEEKAYQVQHAFYNACIAEKE